MKKNKLLTIAKWVWIIAVVIAGGYFLITNWEKMTTYFKQVPLGNLLLSGLFLIAAKLFLVFFSKFSLEKEGTSLPYKSLFRVVAITQLGKYIPGGIWHFVGRYNAYHNHQVSIKKSTKALISENIWMLSGAIVIGSLLGLFSTLGNTLLEKIHLPTSLVAVFLYAALILILWITGLYIYERIFLKQKPERMEMLRLFAIQVITWSLLGISFYMILPKSAAATLLDVIFGYTLSWAIGYVMIFAPGGIGIREGALAWIFSPIFAAEEILIYATVHRFIFVLAEIILGIIAAVFISSQETASPGAERTSTES